MSDLDTNLTDEATDDSVEVTDEKQDSNPAWMAQLPDDYKEHEGLSGYEKLGDLASAHVELRGKAAEYEARAADIPENAEGYDFKAIEGQEDLATNIKTIAAEVGLTKTQLAKLSEGYVQHLTTQTETELAASEKETEESEKYFRGEWGDKYDEKTELVRRAFETFDPDSELLNVFKEGRSVNGSTASLIRLFERIGEATSEGKIVDGSIAPKEETSVIDEIYGTSPDFDRDDDFAEASSGDADVEEYFPGFDA